MEQVRHPAGRGRQGANRGSFGRGQRGVQHHSRGQVADPSRRGGFGRGNGRGRPIQKHEQTTRVESSSSVPQTWQASDNCSNTIAQQYASLYMMGQAGSEGALPSNNVQQPSFQHAQSMNGSQQPRYQQLDPNSGQFQQSKVVTALTPSEQKQIDLWIEQRRKNWPRKPELQKGEPDTTDKSSLKPATKTLVNKASEISELERKLRKKLSLIVSQISGGDPSEKKDARDRRKEHMKKRREAREAKAAAQEANPKRMKTSETSEVAQQPHATESAQIGDQDGNDQPNAEQAEEKKRKLKALKKQKQKEKKNQQRQQAKDDDDIPTGHCLQSTFKYRQNEMLNQLLQSEQDKEASVILQAFRYLVENDLLAR